MIKNKTYLGQYIGHKIEDGILKIDIATKPKQSVNFIDIKITVDDMKAEE